MRTLIIVVLIAIMPFFAGAQSKKEIKEAGIKKITEYKYDYKTGKEKKTKASEITYDSEGNESEVIEYDDFGKITKHEKYTYDADNDKTSVVEYDATGNVKKTTKYTYYAKFKLSKEVYDGSNNLISKKTYEYTR